MVQWYWQSDLRKGVEDSSWEVYDDRDNTKLEKAFQKNQKTVKVGEQYTVDFAQMLQYVTGDKFRQRPIKRVADSKKKRKAESDEDSADEAPKKPIKKQKHAVTHSTTGASGTFKPLKVKQDTTFADFCEEQGLEYSVGCGYCSIVKVERLTVGKEVIIYDTDNDKWYSGDRKKLRAMLGVSGTTEVNLKPHDIPTNLEVYMQSTSYNRTLVAGQKVIVLDNPYASVSNTVDVVAETKRRATMPKVSTEMLTFFWAGKFLQPFERGGKRITRKKEGDSTLENYQVSAGVVQRTECDTYSFVLEWTGSKFSCDIGFVTAGNFGEWTGFPWFSIRDSAFTASYGFKDGTTALTIAQKYTSKRSVPVLMRIVDQHTLAITFGNENEKPHNLSTTLKITDSAVVACWVYEIGNSIHLEEFE